MNVFRFLYPQWLWAIALLPVAYWFLASDEKRRREKLKSFISEDLWKWIIPDLEPGARLRKLRYWLAAIAFVFVALARPQWGAHEEVSMVNGMDIMLLVDVSNSMGVEDVAPSRLKKTKHVIRSILDRLGGDRVGVAAFAGGAAVLCPLTTDLEYVNEVVGLMDGRSVPGQGTDIGVGLEIARKALERGAEETGGDRNAKSASRAILLISDGEDHEAGAVEAASQLQKVGVQLFVFGVGTERGGPVPIRDPAGNLQGYKKDGSGQPVVSTFHPDALIRLATAASGQYWNITPDEAEVDQLIKAVGGLNRADLAEHRYLVYEDRYQFPLAVALILLFLELGIPLRRRSEKSTVNAALVMALMSPLLTGVVSLDTYRENEKGLKAYQEGQLEEAKKRFGTAQAKSPELPELQYNQGLIQAQEGNDEQAARSFMESAKGALHNKDPQLAGRSLFNLGGLLAKKGDKKGAIDSYLAALEANQEARDEKLEKDIRKNIELLAQNQNQEQQKKDQQKQDQQQQQQQQQQNQDQQNQDQRQDQQQKDQQQKQDQQQKEDQKQKQDQQNSQDQKPDQPKDQEQDQQQAQQQKKQKFRSLKLSDEDAERVMAELKNRERELQGRLRKQNAREQGAQKDW